MEISEVTIRLANGNENARIQAYASIIVGGFAVHDIKVIKGDHGLFISMPSRRMTDRCPDCGMRNVYSAHYCGDCGYELDEDRAPRGQDGHPLLYTDTFHPIDKESRKVLDQAVLFAYRAARDSLVKQQGGHLSWITVRPPVTIPGSGSLLPQKAPEVYTSGTLV